MCFRAQVDALTRALGRAALLLAGADEGGGGGGGGGVHRGSSSAAAHVATAQAVDVGATGSAGDVGLQQHADLLAPRLYAYGGGGGQLEDGEEEEADSGGGAEATSRDDGAQSAARALPPRPPPLNARGPARVSSGAPSTPPVSPETGSPSLPLSRAASGPLAGHSSRSAPQLLALRSRRTALPAAIEPRHALGEAPPSSLAGLGVSLDADADAAAAAAAATRAAAVAARAGLLGPAEAEALRLRLLFEGTAAQADALRRRLAVAAAEEAAQREAEVRPSVAEQDPLAHPAPRDCLATRLKHAVRDTRRALLRRSGLIAWSPFSCAAVRPARCSGRAGRRVRPAEGPGGVVGGTGAAAPLPRHRYQRQAGQPSMPQ